MSVISAKLFSILINQLHESIYNKLHKCKEKERDKHRGSPFRIYIHFNHWRLDSNQQIQSREQISYNSTQDSQNPRVPLIFQIFTRRITHLTTPKEIPFPRFSISSLSGGKKREKKKKNNHIKEPSSQDQILLFLRNMPASSVITWG